MSAVGKWLLDFLFPRRCPFCGAFVEEDLPCPRCQELLPWLTGKDAEWTAEFLTGGASALRYQGDVAEAVRRLKFQGKTGGVDTLSLLTAQCAQDHFSGKFDLLSWVPLSPKSLRQRGFDQSLLLARRVADLAGMEPTSLLAKKNGRMRQSALRELPARKANVLGAFSVPDPGKAAGRRVLLVDDVATTCSTLSECARVLLLAGAAEVRAVTLAKAGSTGEDDLYDDLTDKESDPHFLWHKFGI